MDFEMEAKILTEEELELVDGGLAPLLGAMLYVGGYIGTLQVAADFGTGLGHGIYDALNK